MRWRALSYSHRFLFLSYVKSCWLARHATALGPSALSARLDSHQNMEPERDIRARWNTTSLLPPLPFTPASRAHKTNFLSRQSWRRLKFSHFHANVQLTHSDFLFLRRRFPILMNYVNKSQNWRVCGLFSWSFFQNKTADVGLYL